MSLTPPTITTDIKPWYRYGWPWFLMSFPAMAVVLGFHLLYLAMNTNNSLVVDDYYKQGKGINQRIERDRVARLIGVSAQIEGGQEGLIVQLSFRNEKNSSFSGNISDVVPLDLALVHVTLDTEDLFTELQPIGNHRYIARELKLPTEGRWRLHLQPQQGPAQTGEVTGADWRLVSPVVTFKPGEMLNITVINTEQQAGKTSSTLMMDTKS